MRRFAVVLPEGVTPNYTCGTKKFIINQKANQGFDLDYSQLKELSLDLIVPDNKYAKKWDVLINSLGEGTLGRIHLFLDTEVHYAVDQHMTICRLADNQEGAFLYYTLISPYGQSEIESAKTGTTGMTMLNISKVRAFKIVYPTIGSMFWLFSVVLKYILLRSKTIRATIRTLSDIRDSLLPKLILWKT